VHVFSAALPVLPTLAPTTVPPEPVQIVPIDSPDGLKTLTMKKQKTNDNTTYSFLTSAKSDATEQLIFNKTENSSQDISVPYNTWSPDDAFVFLKESTPTIDNYYVLHTSGESFPDGSQYLNIQDLFKKQLSNYTLTDVTGWAAPDLLIVNTKTDQGQQGPSFWFTVSSQSFLQLGTYFN